MGDLEQNLGEGEIQPPEIEGGEGVDDIVEGGEGEIIEQVNGEEGPGWEPNYTFNVLEEQREIDEWARPLITDPEMEAKVRDLYERAHGIDIVKEDRQQLRDHNQQLSEQLTPFQQNYQHLGTMVQNKDYDSFMKQWNIPPEEMVDWAINYVRLNDPNTPQEEKAAYQHHVQSTQQLAQLQYENQQLRSQVQGSTVQQTAIDLNMELAKPDISRVAEEFDSRVGQPGAFRQRVINMGSQMTRQDPNTGQYLSPSAAEAIQQTIQFMGYNPAAMGTPQQVAPQPGPAQTVPQHPQVQAHQPKPVIPTVQGAGTSPVKQQIRSVAKLRELAQQMNG